MGNIPHVHFFNPIINNIISVDYIITLRERGETVKLAEELGIQGINIGKDYKDKYRKIFALALRTFLLMTKINNFDYSLGFENAGTVLLSKLKQKKSILFCDNDVKFLDERSIFQRMENMFKKKADHIIIPECSYDIFSNFFNNERIITYSGYKEDIYIGDYLPDKTFFKKIPFKNYIVIRPETFGSLYVKKKKSLVPALIKGFSKENVNIINRKEVNIKIRFFFNI